MGRQYTQRVFTMPAKSQTVFTQQPKVRHYFTLNACRIYSPWGHNRPSMCTPCQLNHRSLHPATKGMSLLYAKRVQDIQPSGKQNTKRVFTMPAKSQTVFTQQTKVRHYYTLDACRIYSLRGDNTPSVCSPCQLNHRLCSPSNQRYVITIR